MGVWASQRFELDLLEPFSHTSGLSLHHRKHCARSRKWD